MDIFNSYGVLVLLSIVVIISYIFNLISERTKISSVLLLIMLGIAINYGSQLFGFQKLSLDFPLEILGIIGLIMIVLEAALELELSREKSGILLKALSFAALGIFGSAFALTGLIMYFLPNMDFLTSLIYAIPLSVMSSAIAIPSVSGMTKEKKEFIIYECTFSDILGIMFFYFVVENVENSSAVNVSFGILFNIIITVVISLLASYAMIYLFHKITSQVKIFLFLAVLVLLYAVGKYFHLSSLLLILLFGLMLENRQLFFRGKLSKFIQEEPIQRMLQDFKLLTTESSFVIRTFFFVIFGMSLVLSSILDLNVIVVSFIYLVFIYGFRFVLFKLFFKKNLLPDVFIAPRGLITILLYYAIPQEFIVVEFEYGLLFITIMLTSVIMGLAIVWHSKRKPEEFVDGNGNKNNE